jgi:SH3-like domain-containing protein
MIKNISWILFVTTLSTSVHADFWLYRVVRVAHNDVLKLHQQPSGSSSVAAVLTPNQRGITVSRCVKNWCEVQTGAAGPGPEVHGWAPSTFLRRDQHCRADECDE